MASWWQRVGALLLDTLIVGIPATVVALIVNANTGTNICTATGCHRSGSGLLTTVIVAIAELLYFAILDGSTQTVGKRVVGIALRSEATGQPIGFGPALGRWLIWTVLWYLFFIPGLLNALSPLWDSKNQAWHDHVVGSLVVQVR